MHNQKGLKSPVEAALDFIENWGAATFLFVDKYLLVILSCSGLLISTLYIYLNKSDLKQIFYSNTVKHNTSLSHSSK